MGTASPLQLYLSCNFAALDRRYLFQRSIKEQGITYMEAGVPYPQERGDLKSVQQQFRHTVRHLMSTSDFYLVFADRYQETLYRFWIDQEIACALILDRPIIVLQPWSCWSVPVHLKTYADRVVNWSSNDMSLIIKQFREAQAGYPLRGMRIKNVQ